MASDSETRERSPRRREPSRACPPPKQEFELILGPMMSGKSTMLRQRLERACRGGEKCLAVVHKDDTRFGSDATVKTHDGVRGPIWPRGAALLKVIAAEALADIEVEPDVELIGVDEGQFFDGLPAAAAAWMGRGHRVVAAMLAGDFRRAPWPNTGESVALATKITMLSAVCTRCPWPAAPAPYTLRTAASRKKIFVGAAESYTAVCGPCYDAALP